MEVKNFTYPNFLRQKAEEQFEKNYNSINHTAVTEGQADVLKLLHELQVHQIELEMQNEELKQALQKAETATALYDFAPAGYFTLDANGTISQLNFCGSKMLGRERFNLVNTNFKQFISHDSQLAFINFISNIFETLLKQTCEVRLVINTDFSIYVHLEGIISENGHLCLLTVVDITGRKKGEQTLKQAQTNLSALINNREESIWSIDKNYNFIIFNNFFRDECFASYNIELKDGMNALSILPPNLSLLWKQKYDIALQGRRVIFEFSNHVGEELHHYEVFLNPIVSEGKIMGATALSVVITWRKQIDEALRKSEERHRLLADNATDVIWTMDLKGQFTYISPSVKKLCGYSVDEMMMHHSIEEIFTPESVANAQPALKEAFEALQAEKPIRESHIELEQICKDDSTVWTDVTASAMFDKKGEFVGIMGVSRNITQRKSAEEALRRSELKYRTIYESIIDGFAWIDLKGQIIDCNNSFEQMLGYTRQELSQINLTDITREKWDSYEKNIIEEHILPQGYAQVYEQDFIKKDGTVIPVELRAYIVKNEMGEKGRMYAIVHDITNHKRAEEMVRKSEQLYHAIFEKSNAAMLLIDPTNNIIVDANSGACNFYGYSRDKFKELKITDINMQSQSQVKAGMDDISHGKRFYFNFRHKLANSNIRDVEVYSCLIEIEGRILLHLIVHDITDRKMAEESLIASEMRFRSLLQNVTSVAVQGYSPDGKIQYWNHASELLYGYTAQEAIGRNIVKLIVPSKMQGDMNQAIKQMVATGQPLPSAEVSLMRRNGSQVEVFASNAIVQMHGRAPELFCFDIDLTEHKRAEEAIKERDEIYNQFLENSPIYIYFKDEKLRTLRLSHNYEAWLGKNMKELLGKNAQELFSGDFAKNMQESDLMSLKQGIKIENEEEFDGRNYSIIKFPIRIEGKPTCLAGFIIDITEHKRAEMLMKESEARLQELNATKDKFFSIIGHDLKSPFNSILGFSNLLIEQIEENDYKGIGKYAMIIQQSSQRAMNLLSNLLEWSRSQIGKMEFNPHPIDISILINEATELLNDTAQQKSIAIYLEIQSAINVHVDKLMVGTILRNLLLNAIKFTNRGGEIIISTEQKQDQCIVTVADNGIGMKKEVMEKLFRIDVSYSTMGTQNEVGTGLGLILCKDFVSKHGGKIWVESNHSDYGKPNGSKFHFTIPMADKTILN